MNVHSRTRNSPGVYSTRRTSLTLAPWREGEYSTRIVPATTQWTLPTIYGRRPVLARMQSSLSALSTLRICLKPALSGMSMSFMQGEKLSTGSIESCEVFITVLAHLSLDMPA